MINTLLVFSYQNTDKTLERNVIFFYLGKLYAPTGFLTRDINVGGLRPNLEKFSNLTSPSKLKGIASCLMIFVISSTNSSYKITSMIFMTEK